MDHKPDSTDDAATTTVICEACGTTNPLGQRFCGNCGSALPQAEPTSDTSRDERRLATVLFADISGFTAMSEGMDPEDVREAAGDRASGHRASRGEPRIDDSVGQPCITVRTRRRKYEARARTILGQALVKAGLKDEALEQLHAAVSIADRLIGPPARWDARAALGRAAITLGRDDIAEQAYREAGGLIIGFATTLAPERSARLLAAPATQEILSQSVSA